MQETNDSVVNRLDYIVNNPNLNFISACGRFYYKKLMNNPNFKPIESDSKIIGAYEELENKSTFMINRSDDYTRVMNSRYVYEKIKRGILKVCDNPIYVTDVLIDYLYRHKKENKKITLWECFGDIIVNNIKRNMTKDFKGKAIECEECGCLIEDYNNSVKYCKVCKDNKQREWNRINMKKTRNV